MHYHGIAFCTLVQKDDGLFAFGLVPLHSAISLFPPAPPGNTPNAQGQSRTPAALRKLCCFWAPPFWAQKSRLQALPQGYRGREDLFAISPPPLHTDSASSTGPTTPSAQSLTMHLLPPAAPQNLPTHRVSA